MTSHFLYTVYGLLIKKLLNIYLLTIIIGPSTIKATKKFTKYHTTNKCTNCMSFILKSIFKTLFTVPTCFDSISLIIIREHI